MIRTGLARIDQPPFPNLLSIATYGGILRFQEATGRMIDAESEPSEKIISARTPSRRRRRCTSAITAVPHNLLDLRSVRDADIPQCPIIELRQGSDSLFDLTLAMLMRPSACNFAPRFSQPMLVD